MHPCALSTVDLKRFRKHGYVVVRSLLEPAGIAPIRDQAIEELSRDPAPMELESEVGYPGAPASTEAPGGSTPRRLLDAYARDGALAEWARDPRPLRCLARILNSRCLLLSQAHHNCVMTKHPLHSSDTGWHQDVRYWSFSGRDLVNTWLALGPEFPANGGLRVIPGSHRWQVGSERLDTDLFLNPEHPDNKPAIETAVAVELDPGDVLFFHAALFHSATRNTTDELKLSVVFTYHSPGIDPRPGTKSAARPEVPMPNPDE